MAVSYRQFKRELTSTKQNIDEPGLFQTKPHKNYHLSSSVHSVPCINFQFCLILGQQFYESIGFSTRVLESLLSPVVWSQSYLSDAIRSLFVILLWVSEIVLFAEDEASWLVLDCKSFQESIRVKQCVTVNDKMLKMAVVKDLMRVTGIMMIKLCHCCLQLSKAA